MTYQPRLLARGEAVLRHAGGAADLTAHPGEWLRAGPSGRDEVWEVASVALTLGGEGLLGGLDGFAGAAGALELGVELLDGYGAVRDLAALTPVAVVTGAEWRAGSHQDSFCDAEAGRNADGSERAGLRGLPDAEGGQPAEARWTSPLIDLRHGREIVGAGWEALLMTDGAGGVVGAPRIELRTGRRGLPPLQPVQLDAFRSLAATPAEAAAGSAEIDPPLDGDVLQWRVSLPYVDPGVAARPGDATRRTAVVFSLCAWVRLEAPRWRFGSVGEIVERSELGRHLQPDGLSAGGDLLLLRVPLQARLHGARRERIRARLDAGAAGALAMAEAWAVADLTHDPMVA